MLIYWLLFGAAALMAMIYPYGAERGKVSTAQAFGLWAFVAAYAALGGLRDEIGGDWGNYVAIFDDIDGGTVLEAMSRTDALYGVLNWFSVQVGGGIYLVNAVCCLLLGLGTVSVARRLQEPWMAVVMAVPYLLIVVGLGYVRQGAAIGCVLIALSGVDRARISTTVVWLICATLFHATAAITFALFAFTFFQRNRVLALVAIALSAAVFISVLAPRLDNFQTNYLEAQYDSGGAAVRVLMGLLPALVLLLRWRRFSAHPRSRSVWLMIALANVLAAVLLVLSPSSTAVDRMSLFVSVVQLAVFGEFRGLLNVRRKGLLAMRISLIGVAAAVQAVWLVFSPYAIYWVPYNSILASAN